MRSSPTSEQQQHLSRLPAAGSPGRYHNGPVSSPSPHSANNQIQPKIVISSEISSNSAAQQHHMDMNCHDRDSNLTSQQHSRMCSKDTDKSQVCSLFNLWRVSCFTIRPLVYHIFLGVNWQVTNFRVFWLLLYNIFGVRIVIHRSCCSGCVY